jgi:signal transduction histidine kinase
MTGESDTLSILLVEDNPGDANLVEHHLRRGSYPGVSDQHAVTHVESLEAALGAVEESTFDFVLLDLGLPECSGVDTLERLLPQVSTVPVVVLTGLDDKQTAVEAIQKGAQDYLPKDDLSTDVLMRSMRYAIERKNQELALRKQTEQMKFFNSVLRHDVGNGMEVIRRNAQLLGRDADGETADRADTILSWSNDIIDLTGKIRRMLDAVAGEDTLDRSPVRLEPVLRERIEQARSVDEDATIEASLPDGVRVYADDMLDAVFGNLLSNAVEHNDKAEPRVHVDVTERADTVVVDIADNGPGIPDGATESIFGWGETRRSSDGGFGLYFVQTMLEHYGGGVEILDNEPDGSVFRVTLDAV